MDCSFEPEIIVGTTPLTDDPVDLCVDYSTHRDPHHLVVCVDTTHARIEAGALFGIVAAPNIDAALTGASQYLWYLHQCNAVTLLEESESDIVFDFQGGRHTLCRLFTRTNDNGQCEVLFVEAPHRRNLIAVGRGKTRKEAVENAKSNVFVLWWE